MIVALGLQIAVAQSHAEYSLYYEMPSAFNPSAIGLGDMVRVRIGGRLQWTGLDNSPHMYTGAANMPIALGTRRMGAGLLVAKTSKGQYSSLHASLQAAWKLRGAGGVWSLGVQPGVVRQSLKNIDSTLVNGKKAAFDLGAGVSFENERLLIGISARHITSPSLKLWPSAAGDDGATEPVSEYKIKPSVNFLAICNIPIKNTLIELMPSLMIDTDFDHMLADATFRTRYRKTLSVGVGYRWDSAVYASVGVEVKNFYIGYAYDYVISGIGKDSKGSHEILIGYSAKLKFPEKNRYKHKSIRLM